MFKRACSRQLEAQLNTLQKDGPAAWAALPEEELFTPAGFSSQQAEATEDGDKGGAEVSRHPHRDGSQHHRQHRPDQYDEPPDDRKRTAFFRCVHALTSPRSSSCFWALYRRL